MTRFERVASIVLGISLCVRGAPLRADRRVASAAPVYRAVMALGALFGLAVVGPLTARLDAGPRGFLAWSRSLGHLSFALTLVEGVASPQLAHLPGRPISTVFTLDPHTWLVVGAMGMWLLALNVEALRRDTWPKGRCHVGIAAGALCLAFPPAVFAASQGTIDYIVELPLAIGIGVLAPIWFIWTAVATPAPRV